MTRARLVRSQSEPVGPAGRQMAWAAGFLFAAGAVITLIAALLPQDGTANRLALLVVVGLSGGAAALFIGAGTRLPRWVYPSFNLLGTLLIASLVHFGGDAAGAYTLFFVWIAVYAAYFFPRNQAIVLIGMVSVCALLVLLTPLAPASMQTYGARVQWLTVTGTSVASAMLVALLVETIRRSARTDVLTDAPNRAVWELELPRALDVARRSLQPLSVVVIDLDHFKEYNDTCGHQAGDRLLAEAVRAWRSVLRKGDLLARYGGEEFAVLLPACPPSRALVTVERLRALTPGGRTCSAGIATWDGKESAGELFARADAALYGAKAAGRDQTMAATGAHRQFRAS